MDARLKEFVQGVQDYVRMLGQVGRGLVTRPRYPRELAVQFDAIGWGSLPIVILTGAFTGMVLALQSGLTLDRFGARSIVGRLVSASLVKELGPVLTALMVCGRVGSGIAAELGAMMVTDQISALRAFGSDPIRRLVIPRVVAGTLMLPVLTVVCDAVGMAGAALIGSLQLQIPLSTFWNECVRGLDLADIWMGLIKPVVLGFLLVTISCYVGLKTSGGTQGVGRATTNAVVMASIVILAADFLLTKGLIAVLY